MATYTNAIQKLYVAYFNRPADTAGLAYWEGVVTAANGNTAAVSGAFATSAEYQTEYGQINTSGVISKIYQNLFGHAPDTAGLAYWVKAVGDKVFTIDQAVTQIAAGAQGSDKVAYDNKVLVASAFTVALDTPAEKAGYTGELANAAAKDFLADITTDASATAALVPATLNASVAAVIKAGVPFVLANALAALDATIEAKADFMAANDLDEDEDTDTTDDDITDAADAAAAALLLEFPGYTGTAGVKAAKLADEIDARSDALVAAQKAVTDIKADIAEVTGLATAVANLAAAKAVAKSTEAVKLDAAAKLDAAVAFYNGSNAVDATVIANGSAVGIIKVVSGKLVLETGVTEVTNPGVTALLAASIALEAAEVKDVAADLVVTTNTQIVTWTDRDAADDAALATLGTKFTIVNIAAGVEPTGLQINTEVTALAAVKAAADKAVTDAGAGVTPAQTQAATDAGLAVSAFNTAIGVYAAADTANPLTALLTPAEALVVTKGDLVEDLADAVAAVDEANALVAELDAVNDAIDAAGEVFEDNDFAVPVTLAGVVGGTAENDIFLVGKLSSTIVNFGLEGDDLLFIGTEYTLNPGKIATAGNDSVLEVFLTQVGADVKVTLETKAFGSNSTEAEIVVTLTGVTLADVSLANGIITV